MMKRYMTIMSLRTVGETKILSLNTSQGRYRYHIETTIKTPQTARRKKQTHINTITPKLKEILKNLTNIFSYSGIESYSYLTLPSEALWQAPHR